MAIIMALVLAIIGGLVWYLSRASRLTTESFLVSNRSIPYLLGIATVAATWTQAYALVVGATFAYQSQWHFLWFIVPNILALILVGILAPRIQQAMPRGYTLPQVVEQAFGPGVRTIFFLSAFASLVFIVASTMTALQQWISQQLHIPPWQMSIILGIFAFLWVIRKGLPAAVIGDVVKVALIGGGILGVIAVHVHYAGTVPSILDFAPAPVSPGKVFWMVGIPLFITLFGAVICNPDVAERVYAVSRRNVRRAYFGAAALFMVIVAAYGSLGFLAKNLGISLSNTQPPALAVLQMAVPQWAIIIVTAALVIILAAALASLLASAGDLVVIEVYRRVVNQGANDEQVVKWSRIFMTLTVILGTMIAALNLDLTLLIQSMAVIRGEVVIPLLLALFWPKIAPRRYIFWGMLVGVIGGIVLTFGASFWESVFNEKLPYLIANGRPLGALVAFFTPLLFLLLAILMRQVKNFKMAPVTDERR